MHPSGTADSIPAPVSFTPGDQSDLDWLYRRLSHGIKPGLDRVHAFLNRAGIDCHPAATRFIHIAGTNGKGSVCALIHALLRAHGHRAGRFTSPHLIDFNERFHIDDQDVDPAQLAAELQKLRQLIESWATDPTAPAPTFFEITFALALRLFKQAALPWAVLETGMGGRLDATNLVTPVVTVITPIALDHTLYLGDTLEKIAAEKAGIIKPGIPVLTAPQVPEVMLVLQAAADRVGAPLTVIEESWPVSEPLALAGDHSRMNAALALAAVRAAGIDCSPTASRHAFTQVHWPARFQTFNTEPPLVIDGAHNAHAMQHLAITWRQQFPGQQATLLLGVVADKDIEPMLAALEPIARRWIASQPPPPRGLPAHQLAERIRRLTGPDTAIDIQPDPSQALRQAMATTDPILASGSLFFAAEILAHMKNRPIPRPTSAQ